VNSVDFGELDSAELIVEVSRVVPYLLLFSIELLTVPKMVLATEKPRHIVPRNNSIRGLVLTLLFNYLLCLWFTSLFQLLLHDILKK
jgi:hypothetical protein